MFHYESQMYATIIFKETSIDDRDTKRERKSDIGIRIAIAQNMTVRPNN